MAGAFTHWRVVEEAIDGLPDGDYATILGQKKNFVSIGAVGPDYPYMSELEGNLFKIHSWADRMHYENSLCFVRNGFSKLLSMDRESEDFRICLAWFCGYVSHLMTDMIIHPVVNAIVGGIYLFTSHDHRICEMIQDASIFYEKKHVDISNAAYVRLFTNCSDPHNEDLIHPTIRNFWPGILKSAHRGAAAHFDKIDPDKWHKAYLSKLNVASEPIPIFRHIGEELHLVYKKYGEIDPVEAKKYFTEINLPRRKTPGDFRKDAFDITVKKVVEVWQEIFADIAENDASHCQNYLGNWNLDTGVDQDDMIFWE
jgi:hypothetical protein